MTWSRLARIAIKTALLFALCNLIFAAVNGIEWVDRLSLYNLIVPGRERLPYGESPAAYNLSLDSLPAMVASHVVSRPKAADEYRVILIGDSGVWGWLLPPDQTLAAALNARNLKRADGRQMVFYNLAYPIQSLLKDALILDEAMAHQPDEVVWLITLDGFPRDKQVYPPLVQRNAERARAWIERYALSLDSDDPRYVAPTFWDQTIIGARRPLADWLRLQVYGFSWAITGIDQVIPATYPPNPRDLDADLTWNGIAAPRDLTRGDLAFDVLEAGAARLVESGSRLLIVDEPIYISTGANSDLRYNSWYPRWAFDAYRDLLAESCAAAQGWSCLELWDTIPAQEFTDSPVHLTADGVDLLAGVLGHFVQAGH